MLQLTRKWIAPVLAVLAIAASQAPSAQASFTLEVIEDGTSVGIFTSGGPGTLTSDAGTITIDTTAINLALSSFQINSLSASTNSVGNQAGTPGSDDLARLFQGGTVQLKSGATGNHTLEIVAFDDGYTFPIHNPKVMTNSASTTFGNATASSRTFQGTYDDASTTVSSAVMNFVPTPNHLSPPVPDAVNLLNSSSGPPFSLTNTSSITLGNGSSTAGFQGTTFVTAVPEPNSLALGLISLPALLALGRRMRRRVG